ncbi:MAG: hypothetical protein IKC69_03080 [Clostridia bacterium]|nr:hypothetical protein [Clostridia bacterium]MBR2615643.1 hypothetical protein [Clostridia bacterium]
MRRFWTLFLALCFLVSAFPVVFAAERGRISLSGETEGLTRGDAFTLNLEMNRNPGIVYFLCTVTYDPAVLELRGVTDQALLPGFSETREEGKLVLRWRAEVTSPDLEDTGLLARLLFAVKENAPLGETSLTTEVSERFFDAGNRAGRAVPFDCEGITVPLECLHVRSTTEVLEEASFEKKGLGKRTCLDCGTEWETELLPTVSSPDGAIVGEVQPGEYSSEDGKSMTLDYLYGGEEFDELKGFFGDTLIRAFRVRFLKNGNVFFPEHPCRLHLQAEFEVPPDFALYILVDGTPRKMEAEVPDGVISFDYSSYLFAVVSREARLPEPEEGSTAPEPLPELPEVPLSSGHTETEGRGELLSVFLGVLIAAACAAGAVLALRKGKRNAL